MVAKAGSASPCIRCSTLPVSPDKTMKKDTAQYENRYVLFVDILGFKNMIESGEWAPQAIVSALRKAQRTAEEDGERIRTSQFSDSIIMSVPADEQGLLSITGAAFFLAIELVQHRVLLRGGISKGLIYHQGSLCFGPAVISAYALEQQAKYPRVVLEKDLLARASWPDTMDGSEKREFRTVSVPRDEDGQRFVDYFHPAHGDEFDAGWDGLQSHYAKLDELVAAHAASTDAGLRAKYDWLSRRLDAARARLQRPSRRAR